MIGTFLVVDERFEEFQAKSGHKRARRLALLDQSSVSLINTVDWEPNPVDTLKLPPEGKIKGQIFTLGVRDIRAAFGNRFQINAELVSNDAGKQPTK